MRIVLKGVVMAAALGRSVAHAGPAAEKSAPELEIAWQAPERCPQEEDVRSSVLALLGEGGPERRATATAKVSVLETARWGMELEIKTKSSLDRRSLEGASCRVLADAAALLIAIAVDPIAVTERVAAVTWRSRPAPDTERVVPEPPPLPKPEPAAAEAAEEAAEPAVDDLGNRFGPPTEPAAAARTASRSRARRPIQARFAARPWGGGSFGVLPSFGGTIGATAAAIIARARIELGGGYWFGGDELLSDPAGVGGSFDLWALALRGCGTPSVGSVDFPLCAGVEMGAMRGQGTGIDRARQGSSLWAGLQLAPSVAWAPIPRLALWASPEVVVALRRPRFHIDGLGEVFRAGPAGLRLLAGLEVRLP